MPHGQRQLARLFIELADIGFLRMDGAELGPRAQRVGIFIIADGVDVHPLKGVAAAAFDVDLHLVHLHGILRSLQQVARVLHGGLHD